MKLITIKPSMSKPVGVAGGRQVSNKEYNEATITYSSSSQTYDGFYGETGIQAKPARLFSLVPKNSKILSL